MLKIDAHQHFWKYNTDDYVWMDDKMEILKRDYLPYNLAEEQRRSGYAGSISVQARQLEKENEFLLTLAENNPEIKGIVGWVNLRADNVEEYLSYYSKYEKFCGVRHVIHDEPDIDFMLDHAFIKGISKLQQFGLTYDILIFTHHLPNTIKLIGKFPDLKFVLDHIGKPLIKDKILEPWDRYIQILGDFPNVYCKLSGMVTEADWNNWKPSDLKPYIDIVYEAFGEDRLMIGSDWPVCRLAGEYASVMGIVENYFSSFPENVREKILSGNCLQFYNIT
jgi:L-fuconolactonase